VPVFTSTKFTAVGLQRTRDARILRGVSLPCSYSLVQASAFVGRKFDQWSKRHLKTQN